MRITQKGQVTIPIEIRQEYGLLPDSEVDFIPDDKGGVRLVPAQRGEGRGERLARRMYGKATAPSEMSTDQLMALLRDDD